MISIRDYCESDAESVGRLIADTYAAFNLAHVSPEERDLFLGPFRHARSSERAHQEAIARVIRALMVLVAVGCWLRVAGSRTVFVLYAARPTLVGARQ
jgi:hypothetical protein